LKIYLNKNNGNRGVPDFKESMDSNKFASVI
jgi:hypothetical protein